VYPHSDHRSKPHKQWSQYGIATLQASNTKLKKWLNNAIEKQVNVVLTNNRK
jgi:catechol-2,3-dioxygenase